MQVGANCDLVQQLNATQSSTDRLAWVGNSRMPVLIGGHVGFIVAYCLGLYTIFHVARAYKKLELKVCLLAVLPQSASCIQLQSRIGVCIALLHGVRFGGGAHV